MKLSPWNCKPVRIFDGNGKEWKKVRNLCTTTGQATVYVTDSAGRLIERQGELAKTEVVLELPITFACPSSGKVLPLEKVLK